MKIIGIDPGLHITGFGVISVVNDHVTVEEAGIVRTLRTDSIAKRIEVIFVELSELLEQFHPDVMVVEQLFAHYKHPSTAIKMGHARGVILLTASLREIPIIHYSATKIKMALTGRGRAGKYQVQQMIKSYLGLDSVPEPPDVADALAAALCHMNVLRHETGETAPK